MIRNFILLAASRKYGKYCIAGLDLATKKLIRLITDDSGAHYAIDLGQMTYADGKIASKYDLIEIDCTDRSISYFQNENYIVRPSRRWQKIRTSSLDEVLQLYPVNQCDMVFYDTSRKLRKERFLAFRPAEISSLALIRPDSAEVIIQEGWGKRQAMIDFIYKGNPYYPFPVTDIEFMEQTKDLAYGRYPLKPSPIMLCSVGECFGQDNCHYKIAASVLGLDSNLFLKQSH